MSEPILDLDVAVHPDSAPGLNLGELIRFGPVLEEILTGIEDAIAGHPVDVPAIKFRIKGELVTLGPIPVKVG